jgi:protein HIRA/HIR1
VNVPDLKMICTVSYVDSKLSALAELNNPAEYRSWFLAKVKYMAHQGMEERLRCMCEDLLGPVHRSAQRGKNWQPTVMVIFLRNCLIL